MAGELIGGAFLSAFLQVLFDRMISQEFTEFVKGRKVTELLVKKLKITMNTVNGVLNDAEEKQISNKAVKNWVDELVDTVYDADDLLDEIAYDAFKLKLDPEFQTPTDQVRRFFSSFNPLKSEMEVKLEEILERLEYLANQKEKLGLRDCNTGEKPFSYIKVPTTSLLDKSVICGRGDDKEAIMKKVLNERNENLDVIAIVGMGGIGKTTLAQLVYNDSRLQGVFDVKIWVCVSMEFDVFRLTKAILRELGTLNCDNITPNQLHVCLEEKLKGKKFILVLDDVWNDRYEDWDSLRRPLKSGAKASKIIVTTRNDNVASIMGNVLTYRLRVLNDDDSWSLFVKHAFGNENSGVNPTLEAIGKELVGKCKGLPLATKVLGGILRSKRDAKQWEEVLNNNLWEVTNDNILPVLRLSYHYLPSNLKRCFSYCAIFPQDYKFKKEEMIQLWMAEGLIVQSQNKVMEKTGNAFFDNLVSRSFFQREANWFVMHDLINDLAKVVSGEFCFRFEWKSSYKVSQRTRHVSYITTDRSSFAEVYEARYLRTFLPLMYDQRIHKLDLGDEKDVGAMFKAFGRLRVLSLYSYPNVAVVQDSIGFMKHLRYLDLSRSTIEKLTEDFCSLFNLQTLLLYCCQNLVELPNNLSRLTNLYHLDICKTRLRKMPPEMGKLSQICKLTDFIVGDEGGSSIAELGELQHLTGKLCIRNIQYIKDAGESLSSNLRGKQHLKELELYCSGNLENSVHGRDVLEQLQPHKNLEKLKIHSYGGTRFPNWTADSSYSDVVRLELAYCKYCLFLPPLGQLPSLKHLIIKAFEGVEAIGDEFYGSTISKKKPFPCLEELHFELMPMWYEWKANDCAAFPLLQKLTIRHCPNLTGSLPENLSCLTTLNVWECPQLIVSVPRPALQKLYVNVCHLIDFESTFTSLVSLNIRECSNLVSFPERGLSAPNLIHLELRNCSMLKLLPNDMHSLLPSLELLLIYDCPEIEAFPVLGLPSKLKTLQISGCRKLTSGRKNWDLQMLPSLSELLIMTCDDAESFLDDTLLPCTTITSLIIGSFHNLKTLRLQELIALKSLRIENCPVLEFFPIEGLPSTLVSLTIVNCGNLTSLETMMLHHLTSLQKLIIRNCYKIQCMPELGLPFSLSYLSIRNSPMLEQSCKRDSGQDWPKISHISRIYIDYKLI